MDKEINKKEVVAEKFAALIKKLAEEGNIDSLTITLRVCDNGELVRIADECGMDVTVITHSCC